MTWIKSVDIKQEVQIKNKNSRYKCVRDGPWAWLVAFASALGLSVTCSFFSNNGLFYTYMVEELSIEFTLLTLIGSINTAIGLTGAVFAVQLIERFDVRPVLVVGVLFQFLGCFMSSFVSSYPLLFFSMAVVLGIGSALSYVTFIVAVDKYFDKKKSIAMPLATSGASLSGTIFAPICQRLLEHYGFHGAMLIYSAIFLNCLVCAALVFPLESKESQRKVSEDNSMGMSFSRKPSFILYMLTNLLYIIANFIPNGLLPETALSKGVTQNDISLTFSVNGITQVIGRLMFGFLSHRLPHHIKYLWIIYLFGFGLSLLIVPLSTTLVHFFVYNLINGIFNGGANMGYNLTLRNIVEPKHYGRAISIALVMQGLGALVGNPFAAFLKDVSGSGDIPYYFGCFIFILSGLVLLPISNINQSKSPEIEITVSEKGVYSHKVIDNNFYAVRERDYELFNGPII
ncbi:monocarboxylate transporter 13-like [Mytilus edulis]|uniref:monocarboxylate transporter 13-like n=1 Tax=Mytilus edulis TaxID=6550 RepID=UPI0039EE4D5A